MSRGAVDTVRAPTIQALVIARWLSAYARRRWRGMAAVLAAVLLKIAVDLVRPWPTKLIIDHALQDRPLSPGLAAVAAALPWTESASGFIGWCVAATLAVFAVGWMLNAWVAVASVTFGKQLLYDVAADLFAHLQRLSLRFHRRGSTGDAIRRVLVDSNCVSTIVKDALIPVLTALVTLLAVFAVLWTLNPVLALTALAVVPVMAWTLKRYAGPLLDTSHRQQAADVELYETVERTVSAIPVVQAFAREAIVDRELRRIAASNVGATVVATDVQLRFKVAIGFTTAVGTAALLWLGSYQVADGALTTGGLLVILAYLNFLYAPLSALAFTSSTVQGASASAARVLEVWQTAVEPKDAPGAAALTDVRGEVVFEQVTVGYEANRPILHDVTFRAAAGTTVAIVGPTGAGKNTLVSLIPRFLDAWSGRVTLDGQDLRQVSIASLRRHVSLVLQDSFLFPISIAQNIAYGRPDASTSEVEIAARAANAHEFIARLPEGYDTVVGERGATLSGGERQRLSIARALLKNAPVLILDEPTASLDVRTESLLMDALRRLTAGRTTFIIAHRLSTIRSADLILVLDEGCLLEAGPHDELLARRGVYASLYARQIARTSGHTAVVTPMERCS